jgi:hypothetical protein
MRLVASERGRFVALFPIEEIRPSGGIILAELLTAIHERYGFLHYPKVTDPDQSRNLVFRTGSFGHDGERFEIRELGIFNDGIATEARTTEIAELLFDDFLSWTRSKINLRPFVTQQKSGFSSELVVEFAPNLNSFIAQFEIIKDIMVNSMSGLYELDSELQATRIWFGQDPMELSQGSTPTDFGIERRANVAFAARRLFSSAPLPTEKHVKLLEQIEARLSAD